MSGTEPIKLNFGKKLGYVELKDDTGVQLGAFGKDKNLQSIFAHYDDGNGILDKSEITKLYEDLKEAAKNGDLSAGEARSFLKSMGLDVKRADARDVIKNFVNTIGGDNDAVVNTIKDADNNLAVKYRDNGKEELYRYNKDENKSVLEKQQYLADDGWHEISFDKDGKTKTMEIVTNENTVTNTIYVNGQVSEIMERIPFNAEDYTVGAEELPAGIDYVVNEKMPDGRIVQVGFYAADDELLALREISEDGKTIVQKDADNNEVARFVTGDDGQTVQESTDGNGQQTVVQDGKTTTQLSSTRTMVKEGDKVTLKEGDNEVELHYDDEGHVISYPKEGEHFKDTARRLGIDVDNEEQYKAFCELNATAMNRSHGGWFRLGEEVKLPSGFEANLNIDGYEVDRKAEEAKYKERVGASSNSGGKPAKVDPNPPTAATENIPEKDNNPPAMNPVPAETPPPDVTLPMMYYKKEPDKANKDYFQNDGTVLSYNKDGYISEVKDRNGNVLRDIYRNDDGSISDFYDSEYDSNGNKTLSIGRNSDGTIKYYYEYEYDGNGKVVKHILRKPNGSMSWQGEGVYDANGKQIRYINIASDPSETYYKDYEYDSNDRKTREVERAADGTVKYYTDYEYDDDANTRREIHRNADGSIEYYWVYELDEDGDAIKGRQYDADGKLTYSWGY